MKEKVLKNFCEAYQNRHQNNIRCGTAPFLVCDHRSLPYSKSYNRLHDWLCCSRKDPEDIFYNQMLPKEYIRGILNGEEELTVESLYYSIAVPYNLNKNAFHRLTCEVLGKNENSKISKSYFSLSKKNLCEFYRKAHRDTGRERTVLITGASGLIARNLLKVLKNCRLVLLYHKIPSPKDMEFIPDGSILYIGDIRNEILIKRIFLENRIDIVYWMAGMTTRSQCSNPVGTYFHNCYPLHVIYRLMDEKLIQIKGIILPSTCLLEPFDHYSIKGFANILNKTGVFDQYTASKLLMELEAVYFSAQSELPVVIVRLSQVYGNDPDSERLIPVSIKKAMQGNDLICVVDKTGNSQQIAPLHVLDAANALNHLGEKIMSNDYDFCSGRYLNITGPQILTVEEVMVKISNMFQKKVGITKLVKDDCIFEHFNFSTDEARRKIGFMPGIMIDEGLKGIVTL